MIVWSVTRPGGIWPPLHGTRISLLPLIFPKRSSVRKKVSFALGFFWLSMFMILFTDFQLSIALLTGAIGMILTGVLSMDEPISRQLEDGVL